MPKITVYITNKNYSDFLEKSINSVLKQNFKDFELIIVDDGSTDDSQKKIEKYRYLKNVRIFYRKSQGLIKTINFCIKASKGDFILRLDADDFLDENALMILYNAITKSKDTALVYSDYYTVDKKDRLINLNRNIDLKKHSKLFDIPAHGACSLIRKECLEDVGLYDSSVDRQDGFDIWFKFVEKYKIRNINIPLFYYRQHDKNLTKNQKNLLKVRAKLTKKFVNQKKIKIKKTIAIVIPVRGKQYDNNCMSLEKLKNKKLIHYTIEQAFKCKFKKKIIVTTSDTDIIKNIKKSYKNKINIHRRDKKLSFENVDYKTANIQAIKKFFKKKPDIIVILSFENPYRESFYIDKAVNTMILNKTKSVISVQKDMQNKYFTYGRNGLKSLTNNNELILERKSLYKASGGISVFAYKDYLKKSNKTSYMSGHIMIDDRSSFNIKSSLDLKIAEKNLI
jgi:glycosyltransferase involved in cell wall biosynthesis